MEKGIRVVMRILGMICVSCGVALYSIPAGLIAVGIFLLATAHHSKEKGRLTNSSKNTNNE